MACYQTWVSAFRRVFACSGMHLKAAPPGRLSRFGARGSRSRRGRRRARAALAALAGEDRMRRLLPLLVSSAGADRVSRPRFPPTPSPSGRATPGLAEGKLPALIMRSRWVELTPATSRVVNLARSNRDRCHRRAMGPRPISAGDVGRHRRPSPASCTINPDPADFITHPAPLAR